MRIRSSVLELHADGWTKRETWQSTVVGANLCARDPLEVNGKGIRGEGGVADKKAYTVKSFDIISQRQYFVAHCIIFSVGNIFGLHGVCVSFHSTRKLVT
jgi:hypothetical protein